MCISQFEEEKYYDQIIAKIDSKGRIDITFVSQYIIFILDLAKKMPPELKDKADLLVRNSLLLCLAYLKK